MANHPNRARKYFGSVRIKKIYLGQKSINIVFSDALKLKYLLMNSDGTGVLDQSDWNGDVTLHIRTGDDVLVSGAENLPMELSVAK
jgi:hypothetical protein